MTKIIIVGGVAGGMSAATRLRRLMEDAEIIVFDKGPYVSFANCGLPFHVSGEIAERDNLLVQTPERLKARFNIDVRPESEVLSVDADKKEITVRHDDKVYTESYDKLILSPGAKPFVPEMEGLDSADNVLCFATFQIWIKSWQLYLMYNQEMRQSSVLDLSGLKWQKAWLKKV